MGEREKRIAAGVIAVALLLAGLFTKHWWSMSMSGLGGLGSSTETFSGHMGLRAGETCIGPICETVSIGSTVDRGVSFQAILMLITFWGGLLVVIALGIGLALRELRGQPWLARTAGTAAVVHMLFCIATVVFGVFSGGGVTSLMPGYSGVLAVLGCILASYASRLESSGWDGSGELVRVTPPVRAASTPSASDATAPPSLDASQRLLDMQSKARDAVRTGTATPTRAELRARGAASIADASIDSVRSTIRFAAVSIEIGLSSIAATLEGATKVEFAWTDVTSVLARKLPPDPPYDKIVFVDLVVRGRTEPIRILPSTMGNYGTLPGPASVRSVDNLRKLGAVIAGSRAGVIEAESEPFFAHGKEPPAFLALKQFVAFDARYG